MMPVRHERLVAHVQGRVQGVGFRAFVYDAACALGIAGSVQNCRDGRVRVEAEGPRESLDRLLQELRSGPTAARVDRVQAEWGDPKGMTQFTIEPM